MKNKGFTLVELLAVIAVLGFLVVIVGPNIINSINKSKNQNFITETREVCREATNTYVRQSILTMQGKNYYKFDSITENALGLEGRDEFHYYIKVNTDGAVIGLLTWDGTHTIRIVNGSGIEPNDITESNLVTNVDTTSMTTTKAENILR